MRTETGGLVSMGTNGIGTLHDPNLPSGGVPVNELSISSITLNAVKYREIALATRGQVPLHNGWMPMIGK
jgi:hypothetical protein